MAPHLVYCAMFKPCSDGRMVYFLVGFSVPSSLYLYLWLHVVELALVLVPGLLMVPTYCFLSWDGFRVEKYAREAV